MASNKTSQHVRRTASARVVSSTAILAAAMVHLAGTAVSIAQVTPATTTPAPSSVMTKQAPKPAATTPAQPTTQPSGQPATGTPGSPDGSKPDSTKTADGAEKVHVDGNQIVDLHVNDEDLANVLEMLSIQSQKNIVASKSVTARVTANLYGVTFFEALDAILNVNGFGYVEDGNFIFVYTTKELEEIRKAQRVKVSKVVTLNYLNAVDAAEFVKPLLSEGAQIKTNGKTGNFPSPGEVPLGNEEFAGGATLVITDFDDHIGEIESLLHQLDTRPAQVLVEATIMQTTLSEDNAFGVDFSIIADMNFGDFFKIGGPIQAANALIGGTNTPGRDAALPDDRNAGAISSNVGNTAGPAGLKLGIVKGDVAVFMRVLDEVTDTTVLSNPKILALNRQPARVLVGRKVGYLSTTSTDTATTQTVEFLDTGTQLYFRPFVSNEGVIRMELKPQVSEAVIRDSHDAAGKDVTIPDEITNELVTNVMVHDGQTIVLGGLFREAIQTTRRQIPFLGDIPLIGYAFRGNEDNTQRNEIIFLITPSIVNDQTLTSQGESGKEYVDHLRVGSREGVLFFSRDKLTNRRNLKAVHAFEEGDTEGALWNVQRSLTLNHNQPEIVAMREKLTGQTHLWPTRSFMERVIHGDTENILKKGGKGAQNDSPMFPGNAMNPEGSNPSSVSANFNTSFSNGQSSDQPSSFPDAMSPMAPSPTTPTTPGTDPSSTPTSPDSPSDMTPDNGVPNGEGNSEFNGQTPSGTPSNFNGNNTQGASGNGQTPSGTPNSFSGNNTQGSSGNGQTPSSTTPAKGTKTFHTPGKKTLNDGSRPGFSNSNSPSNSSNNSTPAPASPAPTSGQNQPNPAPSNGSSTAPSQKPSQTPPSDQSQPSPTPADDSAPMDPENPDAPTDPEMTTGANAQANSWSTPATSGQVTNNWSTTPAQGQPNNFTQGQQPNNWSAPTNTQGQPNNFTQGQQPHNGSAQANSQGQPNNFTQGQQPNNGSAPANSQGQPNNFAQGQQPNNGSAQANFQGQPNNFTQGQQPNNGSAQANSQGQPNNFTQGQPGPVNGNRQARVGPQSNVANGGANQSNTQGAPGNQPWINNSQPTQGVPTDPNQSWNNGQGAPGAPVWNTAQGGANAQNSNNPQGAPTDPNQSWNNGQGAPTAQNRNNTQGAPTDPNQSWNNNPQGTPTAQNRNNGQGAPSAQGWNNNPQGAPANQNVNNAQGTMTPVATGPTSAPSARLWCGRHSFMQGMWSFYKFNNTKNQNTTVTQGPDSTTPESTDR
jgi:type IV pilus secretin PilQ/predicted competence protein